MVHKLSYRLKASLLVFTASMIFFCLLILLEDALVLNDLMDKSTERQFRVTRILIALPFAVFLAIFSYFLISVFQRSVRRMASYINHLQAEEIEESDPHIEEELKDIMRVMRISLFQRKEEEDSNAQKKVSAENERAADRIQESYYNITLERISGLDLTVIPKISKNGNCDLVQILPTQDGCLGILIGSPDYHPLETAVKARIHGILGIYRELGENLSGARLLESIYSHLIRMRVSLLNCTLFSFRTDTRELTYMSLQENPLVVYKNHKLESLGASLSAFLDFSQPFPNLQQTKLEKGDTLVMLSDRIQSVLDVSSVDLVAGLKRKSEENQNGYKNTRELVLDWGRFIRTVAGTKPILDVMAIAALRVK